MDGCLTLEEFKQAYINLGSPPITLTLEEIFDSVDSDRDGCISLEDHNSALGVKPTTITTTTTTTTVGFLESVHFFLGF